MNTTIEVAREIDNNHRNEQPTFIERVKSKKGLLIVLGACLGVFGMLGVASNNSIQLTPLRHLMRESSQGNNNGSGRWGGKITIVDKLPHVCQYESKSVTWFSPNGQGNLAKDQSVTIGPFWGYYTLGVQENVFGNCAYSGTCAWNRRSADNFCYNFNVDSNCKVTYNDCPYPPAQKGRNGDKSPAPDGRTRYSITGSIENGVCKLTVNPNAKPGPFFCSATLS